MADITFTSRFEDGQIEQAILSLANQVDKLQADFDDFGSMGTKAFGEIEKAAQGSEAKVKGYTDQVEKAAKETKEAAEETGRFGQRVKGLLGGINVFGVSLDEVNDSLTQVGESMRKTKGSAESAGTGMSSLSKFAGIAKLGLLALAVAIGTVLIEAFKRYQSNLDNIRVAQAQFKVGTDVALKGIGEFTRKLIGSTNETKTWKDRLFEAGKVLQFLISPINAVSTSLFNQNSQLREQIKLEGQLERQKIRIERDQKIQAANASLQKSEIERLNLIADNVSLDTKTRIAAANKRKSLSEDLFKIEEKNALKLIGINSRVGVNQETQIKSAKKIIEGIRNQTISYSELVAQIEKTGVTSADATKRADEILSSISEIGDIQESLLGLQSEAFNQAQSIRAEQAQAAAARKAEVDEATKAIQELLNTTAAARVQLGDENDGIQFAYAEATAEVQRLKNEYTKLSQILRTGETAQDIERLFAPLQQIADIDFERASFGQSLESVTNGLERLLKAATDPLTGDIADIVTSQTATPLAERLRADGLAAGQALGAAVKQGAALEAAKQQEQGNELARQLIGQLAPEAINAFFEAEQARFELRIAQQDALIAKRQESLDKAKAALEEEQKLEEQGLANGLKDAEKKVAEQERLLRDSENKKLEIERKAANQRKIIAAGQQAVELTLAVAKLISAEASKGLVGLVLAVGGLAIISRLVAAGRSQAANEAGRTAAFATGTDYVEGAGTGTSDSIKARLSRGERVVTARDNETLGGRRMTNKELVQYALIGQRVYDDPLLPYALGLRGRTEQIEAAKIEMQFNAMQSAYESAAIKAAEMQIDYWKTRPINYKDRDGNSVTEWVSGNQVFRQVEERQTKEE